VYFLCSWRPAFPFPFRLRINIDFKLLRESSGRVACANLRRSRTRKLAGSARRVANRVLTSAREVVLSDPHPDGRALIRPLVMAHPLRRVATHVVPFRRLGVETADRGDELLHGFVRDLVGLNVQLRDRGEARLGFGPKYQSTVFR
jgi:hypothetical protein